jgi:hypothetical protein
VAHPVAQRHTFDESIAVLLAMNLVMTSAVMGILRKRDSDPQ